MPLAVWKDLCFDALDRAALARFWSEVIGLDVRVSERNVSLDGPTPRHTIWVNGVDRPHTVKNRVHPDVDCGSVQELVALGARVLAPASETGLGWILMADPEGNEFCAFVREPGALPAYRLRGLGIDCGDPDALAGWWGDVFDVEPRRFEGPDGWWSLEGVAVDERVTLDFAAVPEPRRVPNRVHWDLVGQVGPLLAHGATRLWAGRAWTALADPEGNEFCVFPSR